MLRRLRRGREGWEPSGEAWQSSQPPGKRLGGGACSPTATIIFPGSPAQQILVLNVPDQWRCSFRCALGRCLGRSRGEVSNPRRGEQLKSGLPLGGGACNRIWKQAGVWRAAPPSTPWASARTPPPPAFKEGDALAQVPSIPAQPCLLGEQRVLHKLPPLILPDQSLPGMSAL